MVFANPISDLFGKSPIKPLQEHMSLVANCASQLTPFSRQLFPMNGIKHPKYSTVSPKMRIRQTN